MNLFLNVDNELIQSFSQLENPEDMRYHTLLTGVYHSAVLYSQHRMTAENTKIFYYQMQAQMLRTLTLETKLNDVLKEKENQQLR